MYVDELYVHLLNYIYIKSRCQMAPPQLNIRTRGSSINKPSNCKAYNKKK